MRLLVHNMMCCLKCDSFPLKIEATEVENEEQDENKEFVLNMLQRVDYEALKGAAKDVCNFYFDNDEIFPICDDYSFLLKDYQIFYQKMLEKMKLL